MEVHKQLGHGFLEPVYQAAMAIELGLGIPYQKEVELPVVYKGKKLKTFEEATVICTLRGHRGKGGGASTVQRSKLGNLWIPTSRRFPWVQQTPPRIHKWRRGIQSLG